MLLSEPPVTIWLYTQPTDMRKSYDGLSVLVKQKLQENPSSGQLFVFINRTQTQMKILNFDRTGYCIWSKRLEQGQFHYHGKSMDKQQINWTELKMIIEGLDTRNIRQYKRYKQVINDTF